MATWNTRGLRGSTLEDMVNRTNEKYAEAGLALIQKIPTPITPIKMDKNSRQITLAFFEQKSTVDYIGAVQGIPVCFDAKECAVDTFSLQNIHPHQVEFMRQFEKQGGIAFFLIFYSHKDLLYYLPYEMLRFFWDRAQEGGRKSFRFEELNPEYVLPKHQGILVPYLDILKKDLENLKAARNFKWEVRLGMEFHRNDFSITYFRERMSSGFRSMANYSPYSYKKYDASGIDGSELTGPPSLEGMPYSAGTNPNQTPIKKPATLQKGTGNRVLYYKSRRIKIIASINEIKNHLPIFHARSPQRVFPENLS